VRRLVGAIRDYAWGSRTAIAKFQGRPVPSAGPEAELWLGAHPLASSQVDDAPLVDLIAAEAPGLLGAGVVARFGERLPYLLKVLGADAPLSLQAHPNAEQARSGFAAEALLPLEAQRNYSDPYHKPELLVALEEFDALCGFRDPAASAELLRTLDVPALQPVVVALSTGDPTAAVRDAVGLVMTWADPAPLVADVAAAGRRLALTLGASADPAFELAGDLADAYPGDRGVVLALLLNRVRLAPDEAVFMPAGNLHAYLRGVGIEIMAASDNVLRGGLTPKYINVPELLRILRFEPLLEPIVKPVPVAPDVVGWPVPVDDFALLKAVAVGGGEVALPATGPRIVLCVSGPAHCRSGGQDLVLRSGESAFVAAREPGVVVSAIGHGTAVVFQATTV
jgi:mannose-6-phosphate isomerase